MAPASIEAAAKKLSLKPRNLCACSPGGALRRSQKQNQPVTHMADITALLTDAETLWTAVAALAVIVIGFVAGRKLFRKI